MVGYNTDKVEKYLKTIKHSWAADPELNYGIQILLDENIINSAFAKLTFIEKKISVREIM